jgi:ribose transport system permease protein
MSNPSDAIEFGVAADDRSGDLKRFIAPGNISIVYLYAFGFILFTLWIPDLWLNWTTHKSVLNIQFAGQALVAVALVLPLLAGAFDLSIAGTMNATAITSSWLVVNQEWNVGAAIAAAMVVAVIAGAFNALLVVGVRINSFIATLASGAILTAYAEWRSGGILITGLPDSFKNLARQQLFWGIQLKVLYVLVIAAVIWYVVEHTPSGRYLQATGDNEPAARLAGVRTNRYIVMSLMTSAVIAGFAGVIQTASINSGNARVGDPYLLAAFAAAFLGSTQFKGRFNVWGTLAAVWVLLSGVKGIELAVRSFRWLNSLFFGVALIVAVGFASLLQRYREHRAASQRTAEAHRIATAESSSTGASS